MQPSIPNYCEIYFIQFQSVSHFSININIFLPTVRSEILLSFCQSSVLHYCVRSNTRSFSWSKVGLVCLLRERSWQAKRRGVLVLKLIYTCLSIFILKGLYKIVQQIFPNIILNTDCSQRLFELQQKFRQ